jgi:poly(3-hydroxyoctanoate) depolymerase
LSEDPGAGSVTTGDTPGTECSPAGLDERQVFFCGLRIFVRQRGHGDPILLVNGLGGNVGMWGPTEHRLARRARTIAFDAPGTGQSRLSPVALPVPVVARLIARLLDELGCARVDVLGYSLGGAIAQQLARTAPDRVRRLALVSTSCGWGGAPPDALTLGLISTPLRYRSARFHNLTNHLLDGGDRFRDPHLKSAHAAARNRHPPSMIGYAQQILQGSTWSSLHWTRSLRHPTLIIAGGRDRLVPAANGLLLARHIPQSRLYQLPGEGHLMLFDPGSSAHALLEEFFTASDLGSSTTWENGERVEDGRYVESALMETPGAEPFKSASRLYRACVTRYLARA